MFLALPLLCFSPSLSFSLGLSFPLSVSGRPISVYEFSENSEFKDIIKSYYYMQFCFWGLMCSRHVSIFTKNNKKQEWPACISVCHYSLSIYISALTLAALLSASLFLSHTRPPEPVYSTVNKLSDRAPSPHLYSPVEFDKSPMHSIPHFPHYHVGLLPDSEITRY